jgi:hypothetical protein
MATSIEEIAKRFEPKIRNALLSAFVELKDDISIGDLSTAIRTRGITGAYQYLADLPIEGVIEKNIVDDLNNAIAESGRFTIGVIPAAAKTGIPFRYNLLNPQTVDFINRYEFSLIQKVGANTRQAIRNTLEADQIAGVNPISSARNFRSTLGLTPKQEQAVRNYQDNLENLDRDALNRKLRDRRFDRSVLSAIDSDTPLSKTQINRFTDRYRERFIKYRAEVIARTESLRATSIGEYTSLLQGVNEGSINRDKVRRFWIFTRDSRTRDTHRMVPSLNPNGVAIDQPFTTPLGPLRFPRDPEGSAANTVM